MPQTNRALEQGESSQTTTETLQSASTAHPSGTLITIPILFLEKSVADRCQTRALEDKIVCQMPQMIEIKMSATKKEIIGEVCEKPSVLKERLDGLENMVQDRFQAASQSKTDEF